MPTAFPNAADLKKGGAGIGKLKVTSFNGDTDGDGDYDELYPFGARSFSIWSPDGTLVFDSGDALEEITKAAYPANFNASNTNNTLDDRSDDKGPGAGRGDGGVAVWTHLHLRDARAHRRGRGLRGEQSHGADLCAVTSTPATSAPPGTPTAAGDRGAEAARVIPAESSPNGKPLLLVSNEVSGSLRVFEIAQKK